jgi:phosphatidate cytidylyltransferase
MTRVITAIALAIAACYLVFLSPDWLFRLAALGVGLGCYREYLALSAAHGLTVESIFGWLAGTALIVVPQYSTVSLSILAICALSFALRADNLREILPQRAAEFFGVIYTCLTWHFAQALRLRSVHWLFFALALNWFGDSVAYYVGRAIGKHRLAPIVSPNKSWEGAAGSVVGSVVFGVLYMGHFEPRVPLWTIVLIAAVANVAGQFGDLAESAMKRGAGVKDSGNVLPGHGGLLDRLDSSMFALPVVYTLLLILL